jgi:hypothetical protein
MNRQEAIKKFKESEAALKVVADHVEQNHELYDQIKKERIGELALLQTMADLGNHSRDKSIIAGFLYGLYVGMTRKQ